MGEGGLAAAMAGPSMTYGTGEGNTVQHSYGGASSTPKKQGSKDKGPGTPKKKKKAVFKIKKDK